MQALFHVLKLLLRCTFSNLNPQSMTDISEDEKYRFMKAAVNVCKKNEN